MKIHQPYLETILTATYPTLPIHALHQIHPPWLAGFTAGEYYSIAMSHGEGKFVVSEEVAKELFANGQVATQYVDLDGIPDNERRIQYQRLQYAIEGITSADGNESSVRWDIVSVMKMAYSRILQEISYTRYFPKWCQLL